jgi:hypothetical protein
LAVTVALQLSELAACWGSAKPPGADKGLIIPSIQTRDHRTLELDSLAGTRHPVFASSASQSSITLHAVESDGEPSGENIENSTSDAGSGQTSHDLHPGEKRLILWVAAVSAFAAIAGAGVGGYATYRTATLQTTSASNQEDESRRLVAYSDYLTAIAVYKNQSYYFVTGFGDGSLKTWEARSAVEKDLGPSFLDAQRKGEIVQLVCVEGVCPVVKSLLDASDDLNHLIYQMQNKANANDWSGIEKDLPDLYAKFTKMQDFETDLRVKAHDDLTSEPTR